MTININHNLRCLLAHKAHLFWWRNHMPMKGVTCYDIILGARRFWFKFRFDRINVSNCNNEIDTFFYGNFQEFYKRSYMHTYDLRNLNATKCTIYKSVKQIEYGFFIHNIKYNSEFTFQYYVTNRCNIILPRLIETSMFKTVSNTH